MINSGISELKALAESKELVAPIKYENPKRDKQIFFDFVREYGERVGISPYFKIENFIDGYKKLYQNFVSSVKDRISGNEKGYDNFIGIVNSGLGLILMPITYPAFGGDYWIELDENNPTISIPKYRGIKPYLFGDGIMHEIMHLYHNVLVKDLKNKEIIKSNGLEIEKSEPPVFMRKAPSKASLKKYEKMLLEGIIQQKKKMLGI